MAAFSPVCSLLKSEDFPTDDLPIKAIVSSGVEANLYKIFANILMNNDKTRSGVGKTNEIKSLLN